MLIDIVTGPLPFCFFGGNISSNHRKRKIGQWHIFFLFFSQCGKMFAKNLSCVQNLPPTPTPCPTYSTPSRAWVSLLSLLTSNPPLLNTFDMRICNCACDCIWICICQNCDEKTRQGYLYVRTDILHRARTDPAGWLLTWNSPPEASPSSHCKWTPPPPLHQDSSAVYERWDVRQSCPGQPVVATVGKAGGRSVQCSPHLQHWSGRFSAHHQHTKTAATAPPYPFEHSWLSSLTLCPCCCCIYAINSAIVTIKTSNSVFFLWNGHQLATEGIWTTLWEILGIRVRKGSPGFH